MKNLRDFQSVFTFMSDAFTSWKHGVKSVLIWRFFWYVFSCIQSEYRKIRPRKNSVFGYFSRGERCSKPNGEGIKTWIQSWKYSVAHGQPPFLYCGNYWYEPQQQYSCPLRWLALSRIANTHQPFASKLSYKYYIL